MKKIHIQVLACGVIVSAALWIGGCKKHDGEGAQKGDPPRGGHAHEEHVDEVKLTAEAIQRYGVKVVAAEKRVLEETIVAPGRVSYNLDAAAHVGSHLRGRAVEIRVKAGDAVKKGDVLMVVESPELGEAQADFLQKRIAVQTAGPNVELARVMWERAKSLQEGSQGISLTEVQKREAEHKGAVAAQKAAEGAAATAESRLQLLGMTKDGIAELVKSGEMSPRQSIVAPIDGSVVQRQITQGEMVSSEKDALLVIADMRTLWIVADVPDAKVGEIAKGSKAWTRVGAIDAKRVEGAVAFVAPHVAAATRTVQVRVEVPGTAALRPGSFAQVEIAAGTADPHAEIVIPEEAIQTVEGGPAVFVPVKGEENTFSKRAVVVGRSAGGMVVIASGLAKGDEYVVSGSFILKAELGKGEAGHGH